MSRLAGFLISLTIGLGPCQMIYAQIYRWDNRQVIAGTEGITLGPDVDLSGWNLDAHHLRWADLSTPSMYVLDMSDSNLRASWLDNASLAGSRFERADFETASLVGADLNGAVFTGANLARANLTSAWHGAYFMNADLSSAIITGANLSGSVFSNANLSGADLTNANLSFSQFQNAALTGALVRGANFSRYGSLGTGISVSQLTSTADYAAKNLQRIQLNGNQLSGVDFRGQNLNGSQLEGANLSGANLTDAAFIGAKIRNAQFADAVGLTAGQMATTESYQRNTLGAIGLARTDLSQIDFSGQLLIDADLSGTNLTGGKLNQANLAGSRLAGAKLNDATIAGVQFGDRATGRGLSSQQIYSTASYQQKSLTGLGLSGSDLAGWSFQGQNLTGTDMSGARLDGADLSESTLTNVQLSAATVTGANLSDTTSRGLTAARLYTTASYATRNLRNTKLSENDFAGWSLAGMNLANSDLSNTVLQGTNLAGADLRGAVGWTHSNGAVVDNTILPDGTMNSLNLLNGQSLVILDDDGVSDPPLLNWLTPRAPIPVQVQQQMKMTAGSILELRMDNDDWNSTISFSPQATVELGGVLKLSLTTVPEENRTFRIFDWQGVSPSGQFTVANSQGGSWDLSQLYSTGEVTFLIAPPTSMDHQQDGDVDSEDLIFFLQAWTGAMEPCWGCGDPKFGDGDRDGDVDSADTLEFFRQWTGAKGAELAGVAYRATSVPEPAHLALVGLSLAWMVGRCRPKQQPSRSVRRYGSLRSKENPATCPS